MNNPPIQKPVYKQTFKGYEGDDWDSFILTWRNSDNTPLDFSGAIARCQFKKKRDGEALLTLTTQDSIMLGNSEDNIKLWLTAAQTRQLGAGTFFFDVEITQGGKVRTYADCILILEQSVTQP